jgi:hypothetical protein
MNRSHVIALSVVVALGLAACGADVSDKALDRSAHTQAKAQGTGLVLNSVTGITLPLIGKLGDVNVNQAVITNFALVENTVGQIVGLQVDGVLQLTGGVLGTNVLTENFNTTASVTPSGPGQCTAVAIDLGQISVNALVANVDIPAATVNAQASGAVGSLLCSLANALSGLAGGTGAAPGAGGIVNALNNQI